MKWDVILGITSGIGLMHALLFALFLTNSRRGDRISNLLLAVLLASFAIRIFKSTFYAVCGFIPDWLPATGLMSMSLNGPLLLLYVGRLSRERSSGNAIHVLWLIYAATTLVFVNDLYVSIAYLVIIVANAGYMINVLIRINGWAQSETKNWMSALLTAFALIEVVYFLQWTGLQDFAYVIATTVSSVVLMVLTYLCLLKYDLLRKIHRQTDTTDSPEAERIGAALRKIIVEEQGFLNPELTVTSLSNTLRVTPGRVSICVQKEFNATFPETINKLRLEYVTLRLSTSENVDKIEAIARDAGFPSPSSFYANFKKVYRMTPLEYRTRALAVPQE